ncbi:hypothetical protein TanjilG_10694 [Lupinus angustifolius]|nr:hypothetical protein TanjilG_10694 [Lupinus angustifolius]
MSGAEIKEDEDLIQGTCLVNEISLSVLFDSGATHSFISHDVVNRLELPIVPLPYDLVMSTPTNEPVIVSTVCPQCPIVLDNKTFLVDLICLPLSQLDIILVRFEGKVGDININGKNYSLKQLHWHSPSEHRANGYKHVAELHLVHYTEDNNNIAVVAILYKLGAPNPLLSKVRIISKKQLKLLKAPLNQENKKNARPIQPLNGRKIQINY